MGWGIVRIAKGGKKGSSKRGTKGDRNISSLDQHKLHGKTLKPPFAQVPNTALVSWRDERLPELLWAVILVGHLPRERYLECFRQVIAAIKSLPETTATAIQHSVIAELDDATFDVIFAPLFAAPEARHALSALLLFDCLPDRAHWTRHLDEPDATIHSEIAAAAVAATTEHQSQAATDCRWIKVVFYAVTDRVRLPTTMSHIRDELIGYPDVGDMRSVRPKIRALEMGLNILDSAIKESGFAQKFWQECWKRTKCIPAPRQGVAELDTRPAVKALVEMYAKVAAHFMNNTTTDMDARSDAVFGMVLYGITLALNINRSRAHNRIEGRLAMRTMVEVYLTLAFLRNRDEKALWEKYRRHGVGQAKLAFLKMLDLEAEEVPEYIKIEELEMLANEDVWQEYTEIELGNWAGLDLRKMSDAAGAKDIYDKYYGWPSSYVHGQWSAVRDTVFDLCLNPLHRYHRVPAPPRETMESVSRDSVKLVNLMLDQLTAAYPPFKPRIRPRDEAPANPEAEAKPEPEATPETDPNPAEVAD
ncbi:MAG TPA: DUF5677 domain-containing protein [Stellaceae bacterium]|nr:DUF5677 domain-containing protein [Stellaceae bacterium]